MLGKTVGERVKILEEAVDGVVPLLPAFDLADGHDTLGGVEGAIRGAEILVGEHEDGLARPAAALGDAEEVVLAHLRLAPARLEDSLCSDKLGSDVGGQDGCRIDSACEITLKFCCHYESFLIYSPLSLKSFSRRTNEVGNMG